MPVTFPPFCLPFLRKLCFEFSPDDLTEDAVFGDNRNSMWLLQTILKSCSQLEHLVIPYTVDRDLIPIGFKYLHIQIFTINHFEFGYEC